MFKCLIMWEIKDGMSLIKHTSNLKHSGFHDVYKIATVSNCMVVENVTIFDFPSIYI